MPKVKMEYRRFMSCENQAEATLLMLFECRELDRFVTLKHICIKYSFDISTLEIAARALYRRGLIEKRERKVGRKWWNRRTLVFYRLVVCARPADQA